MSDLGLTSLQQTRELGLKSQSEDQKSGYRYCDPCIGSPARYPLNYRRSCVVVIVVLLFYVHGKHLRSCRDGQLT